jgi:hypothetical protein
MGPSLQNCVLFQSAAACTAYYNAGGTKQAAYLAREVYPTNFKYTGDVQPWDVARRSQPTGFENTGKMPDIIAVARPTQGPM